MQQYFSLIISPKQAIKKSQKPQSIALFTHISAFAGSIAVFFLKLTAEIVDRIKTAGIADLLESLCSFRKQAVRHL